MDSSLSTWRQFLDRLPTEHPLRRILVESADTAAEDAVLRLAAIVESSDDAILSKSLDGRILSWNAGAQRLYGYSPDEVLGRPVSLLVPPGREDDTLQILDRVGRGEGVDHYETTRQRKDGQRIEVSLTISPVRDVAGRVVAASTIARDITERRQGERRLRFLADAGAALTSSLDYHVTLASIAKLAVPRFADWCSVDLLENGSGLTRVALALSDPTKEELSKELSERYPLQRNPGHPLWQAMRSRVPRLLTDVPDTLRRSLALDPRHLELLERLDTHSAILMPLVARGRVTGAITFQTMNGRRRYDEQDLELAQELGSRIALAIDNARLYQEAQEANRIKDEFLATLSHELRTPLTPIIGWTRILRSGKLDAETTTRALEVIERNVQAQTVLISDLLDLSRIITGKLRVKMAAVDVGQVVQGAVDSVRPTAAARGVDLEVKAEDHDFVVAADADRIHQVAWNLLSNATKFTPRGGRVTVTLCREGDEVIVAVSDTGEGIPASLLPRIFERFQQADSSTTRAHGGLGLGLAIVRHLVELHGGTVKADSAGPGHGAQFTVRLPALARSARGSTATDTPREHTGHASLAGLRVLVVDDEADAREVVQALVELRGGLVWTATSADQALVLIDRYHPDLLIADIGMPEVDGYGLIERLRRLPPEQGGDTPALALTAYAHDADRTRALEAGFDGHLPKPVEPDDLVEQALGLAWRRNSWSDS